MTTNYNYGKLFKDISQETSASILKGLREGHLFLKISQDNGYLFFNDDNLYLFKITPQLQSPQIELLVGNTTIKFQGEFVDCLWEAVRGFDIQCHNGSQNPPIISNLLRDALSV